MILIEGSDDVGKSTLAKGLQRLLKLPVMHFGPMPDWWRSSDYERHAWAPAIYDRYHWSEAAYAPIVGREPLVDSLTCQMIDNELRKRCAEWCGAAQETASRGELLYTTIMLYSSDGYDYFAKQQKNKPPQMYTIDVMANVNSWFRRREDQFDIVFDVCDGYPDPADVLHMLEQKSC